MLQQLELTKTCNFQVETGEGVPECWRVCGSNFRPGCASYLHPIRGGLQACPPPLTQIPEGLASSGHTVSLDMNLDVL